MQESPSLDNEAGCWQRLILISNHFLEPYHLIESPSILTLYFYSNHQDLE